MEEVLEKLETTLISQDQEDDGNKTNFDGLYKNWGRLGHQEQRRKDLLDVQKSNRNNKLDKFRGILELVNAVESHHNIFQNEYHRYRPNIYVAGFTKTSASYSNVLMMSEWMIEKPEDFHENWYVTPCPKGVRMLVVATQGRTKCYTKYGHFRNECRTALPGGNPCDPGYKNRCCVLDCFYDEKANTMYIVDLLAWNNQPMTDGETEFRHYWLESQLSEIPQLAVISKKNKIMFKILPKTPCDPESFNKFMMTYPPFENFTPALDGLLFYHKRAHYCAGETPLVGWLFPYMVPEVLGSEITVNPGYLSEKPKDYVNQTEFIQKFEAKYNKKKFGRSRRNSAMDTTPPKPEKKKASKDNNENENAANNTTPDTQCEEMDAEEKPNEGNENTNKMDAEEKANECNKNANKMDAEEKPVEGNKITNKIDAEGKPNEGNENRNEEKNSTKNNKADGDKNNESNAVETEEMKEVKDGTKEKGDGQQEMEN